MYQEVSPAQNPAPQRAAEAQSEPGKTEANGALLREIVLPSVQHVPEAVTNAANSPDQGLSAQEIDARMAKEGFPEMELLWKRFKKYGKEPGELTDGKIENARQHHLWPVFDFSRKGLLASSILAGGSIGAAWSWCSDMGFHGAGLATFTGFTALNLSLLGGISLTWFRRYLLSPMHRIMAEDLAFMLSRKDFRAWSDEQVQSKTVMAKAAGLGVAEMWDNPTYKALYKSSGQDLEQVFPLSREQAISQALKDFLGHKDEETRRYNEGRYSKFLLNGKKSVTNFVNAHKEELALNRQGRLPWEEGVRILGELKTLLKEDGCTRIDEIIASVRNGNSLKAGETQAAIWQRDPWKDLTHQEEFFSSASLRGVKAVGRGPKGRLGTFGYLRNKAISALDFSTKEGRLVRARICAVTAKDSEGVDQPVLFVDGVEGSNAIKPKVIKRGLEDYARASGFKAVLYNKYVYNKIPQRFVKFIEDEGLKPCRMRIESLDPERREYMDAFGLPIEPFEYAPMKGKVTGYLVNLENSPHILSTRSPRWWETAVEILKKNTLRIYMAETLGYFAYNGIVVAKTPLKVMIPLGIAIGAGILAQSIYRLKSIWKK